MLPIEIISLIFTLSSPPTLASAALANRGFQFEAERLLYRNVYLNTADSLTSFSRALATAGQSHRAPSLRTLYIGDTVPEFPLGRYNTSYAILSILEAATNLFDLNIIWEVIEFASPKACFSTQLQRFTTDLVFDDNLLHLLIISPRLKHLSIVESPTFQTMDSTVVPLLESIEGPCSVVQFLAPGRPIRRVEILGSLDINALKSLLSSLENSTAPLETLSIDVAHVTSGVLAGIGRRFPFLRELKIRSYTRDFIPAVSHIVLKMLSF